MSRRIYYFIFVVAEESCGLTNEQPIPIHCVTQVNITSLTGLINSSFIHRPYLTFLKQTPLNLTLHTMEGMFL